MKEITTQLENAQDQLVKKITENHVSLDSQISKGMTQIEPELEEVKAKVVE